MEKRGWKIIAIIFITLFVVENLFLGWGMSLIQDSINKENECAYNVCGEDLIEYYEYFDDEEVCECYDIDMNLIKSKYLG